MPPQDDGVRFENQGEEFGAPPQQTNGFDLTGKLVDWGFVSSRDEAQYVLVAVAVLVFLIAAYFFIHALGGSGTPANTTPLVNVNP